MKDLPTHIALFCLVSFVIVTMSTFFGERDDAPAFRVLPKRFAAFVGGCLVVAAILLVIEHTFASVR